MRIKLTFTYYSNYPFRQNNNEVKRPSQLAIYTGGLKKNATEIQQTVVHHKLK
jgi:hypothetical protein